MSLSNTDLQEIRKIVQETVAPLKGDLEALGGDVKEIYNMIADLQKLPKSETEFQKLNLEKKILKLHSDLVVAAEQAGVTLPSH